MWIEHVAAVVDRRVGGELDVAGVRIDLDLGDVTAVGKGLRRFRRAPWCRGSRAISPRLASSRRRVRRARTARCGDRCRRSRKRRRCSRCPPRRPRAWWRRRSCPSSSTVSTVRTIALPASSSSASRPRRHARNAQIGVAVPVPHLVRRDAEPLGDEPREDGGVTLAGRLHVERQHERVAAGKAQARAFERRAAGMLEEAGHADAAIACRAASPRAGAALKPS